MRQGQNTGEGPLVSSSAPSEPLSAEELRLQRRNWLFRDPHSQRVISTGDLLGHLSWKLFHTTVVSSVLAEVSCTSRFCPNMCTPFREPMTENGSWGEVADCWGTQIPPKSLLCNPHVQTSQLIRLSRSP